MKALEPERTLAQVERAPETELTVPESQRSYELELRPAQALETLRENTGLPVLSQTQAAGAKGSDPFFVFTESGFTLYKPWRNRVTTPEGRALGEDIAVGPAVIGHLVETARGSRLDLTVKRFAMVPSQSLKLGVTAGGALALFAALLFQVGAHPILLGVSSLVVASVLGSIVLYGRQRRGQDIRELLSTIERTFGPVELPEGDDVPHRRGVMGD